MYWLYILLLGILPVYGEAPVADKPKTHIITVVNKLEDRNIQVEFFQENLRCSIAQPTIQEKGVISLVPIANNVINIAPGDEEGVEVRAEGDHTRGHYVANVRPDMNVTIYVYALKDANTRDPDSERNPAVCAMSKPGAPDEVIEIIASRVNKGLACRPRKTGTEAPAAGA